MNRITLATLDLAYIDRGRPTRRASPRLPPRPHHVVRPDRRAFKNLPRHRSGPARLRPIVAWQCRPDRGVTMEQYADDVAALLDAL